jgi:hypothetical protein
MSRLDSFIRRLEAQRRCLDHAGRLVSDLAGPVFEFGLGNGRTFDHLREILPGREIFVFERRVAAHPDCVPDPAFLFEGPIEETLPLAIDRFAGQVAMAHADIGSANASRDKASAAQLSEHLPVLMAPGGVVLSDLELTCRGAQAAPLPESVQPGRYFIYRF